MCVGEVGRGVHWCWESGYKFSMSREINWRYYIFYHVFFCFFWEAETHTIFLLKNSIICWNMCLYLNLLPGSSGCWHSYFCGLFLYSWELQITVPCPPDSLWLQSVHPSQGLYESVKINACYLETLSLTIAQYSSTISINHLAFSNKIKTFIRSFQELWSVEAAKHLIKVS